MAIIYTYSPAAVTGLRVLGLFRGCEVRATKKKLPKGRNKENEFLSENKRITYVIITLA